MLSSNELEREREKEGREELMAGAWTDQRHTGGK